MDIRIDDEYRIEEDVWCLQLIHEYPTKGRDGKPSIGKEVSYPGTVKQAIQLYVRRVSNKSKAKSVQQHIKDLEAIEATLEDLAGRIHNLVNGQDLTVPLAPKPVVELEDF